MFHQDLNQFADRNHCPRHMRREQVWQRHVRQQRIGFIGRLFKLTLFTPTANHTIFQRSDQRLLIDQTTSASIE